MSRLRLGVDLGGTKIEIVALGDAGQQLLRRRIATPQGDYATTIGAVSRLVMAVETELGQRGSLGIGIPGAESLAGGAIAETGAATFSSGTGAGALRGAARVSFSAWALS